MGTRLHGIAASEHLDTSGERINVAGMDISSLPLDGVLNWEHEGGEEGKKVPSQIVGKILDAKKIFSEEDCENTYHLMFWKRCLKPFVYIIGELMDDEGHVGAMDVAAMLRYDEKNKDKPGHERKMVNFSIEGAKLKKEGMDVHRAVARKVTITVHPCNRACDAEILPDEPDQGQEFRASDFFKTENMDFEISLVGSDPTVEALDSLMKSAEGETLASLSQIRDQLALALANADHNHTLVKKAWAKSEGVITDLRKALTVGNYDVAPSMRTGGAALAVEDLGRVVAGSPKSKMRVNIIARDEGEVLQKKAGPGAIKITAPSLSQPKVPKMGAAPMPMPAPAMPKAMPKEAQQPKIGEPKNSPHPLAGANRVTISAPGKKTGVSMQAMADAYKSEDLAKGQNGDWKKEGYSLHFKPHPQDESYFEVHAKDPQGKPAGRAMFQHHEDGQHIQSYDDGLEFHETVVAVHVPIEHKRKGLASAMYQFAEQQTGKKLKNVNENKRTDGGKALWSQPNRPFGKSLQQFAKSEDLVNHVLETYPRLSDVQAVLVAEGVASRLLRKSEKNLKDLAREVEAYLGKSEPAPRNGAHPHSYDWHDGHTGHHGSLNKKEERPFVHSQQHGPTANDQAGGVSDASFHSVMSSFGKVHGRGAPTDLKFYKGLEHHSDAVDHMVAQHGYQPYYAGGQHGKPDLAGKNYNTGHLMIYDPSSGSGGDFGHEAYTDAWRKSHELAHAQTYGDVNKIYGEGRRLGKLGVRSPREMKRAVHWEWLAAHKQRDLMAGLGYHVNDEDFHKELNTIMGDATHRAVTGKFTEPSEMGFEPHAHKVPLEHSLGMIDQHAQKLGLRHDDDTLTKQKLGKSERVTIMKGQRGDWGKEGYSLKVHEPKDEGDYKEYTVTAHHPQHGVVGRFRFEHDGNEMIVADARVHPEHRRKGLASSAYKAIEDHVGAKLIDHNAKSTAVGLEGAQSDDARALWKQPNRPFGKSERVTITKGQRGDWDREGYEFHLEPIDKGLRVRATHPQFGNVGFLQVDHQEHDGSYRPDYSEVKPEHQRKGIATKMYQLAEDHLGTRLQSGSSRSKEAKALWSQPNRPFGNVDKGTA
jgi:GNAT superfamily N-acetyltransferase